MGQPVSLAQGTKHSRKWQERCSICCERVSGTQHPTGSAADLDEHFSVFLELHTDPADVALNFGLRHSSDRAAWCKPDVRMRSNAP